MTEQKAIGWTLEKATVEALERARLGLRALRLDAPELVCADLEALVDTATAACLNEARQQWLARKEDILTASDEAMKLRAECSRLRTELSELRGALEFLYDKDSMWHSADEYLDIARSLGWTPEAKP